MISQDYGEVGSQDYGNWRFIGSANYGQDDANACVVQTGFKVQLHSGMQVSIIPVHDDDSYTGCTNKTMIAQSYPRSWWGHTSDGDLVNQGYDLALCQQSSGDTLRNCAEKAY